MEEEKEGERMEKVEMEAPVYVYVEIPLNVLVELPPPQEGVEGPKIRFDEIRVVNGTLEIIGSMGRRTVDMGRRADLFWLQLLPDDAWEKVSATLAEKLRELQYKVKFLSTVASFLRLLQAAAEYYR